MLVEEVDGIVGKITQEKTDKGRKIAAKALSNIDTKDVESFRDLKVAGDARTTALKNKLDIILEADKRKFKIGDLAVKTKVGKRE